MRITTLGDVIRDVVVRLDGALVPGDDAPAETRAGGGGQAANVAAWAARLGAEARFVGKRGADMAGQLVAEELAGHGVELSGPIEGRTGMVVSIASDGDRTMASDRGSAPDLAPDELEPSWFVCDALHLSGYAFAREPMRASALRAAELARAEGAQVSVDLSAWSLVDDDFRASIQALRPDLVFAGEAEQAAFGELDASWIVKHGADGVVVDGVAHPAHAVTAIDATGAGDAFAAGYLVGGVTLGLETAARCCAKLGARP